MKFRVSEPRGVQISSSRQTLGQRIRWLRAHQHPVMTQRQLADITGIRMETIREIEQDRQINIELSTLRKLAWALQCMIFVNLKAKPSLKAEGECQLPSLELPPPPKRRGIISEAARKRALAVARYPWKKLSPAETSFTTNSDFRNSRFDATFDGRTGRDAK